jgi:hypothetical protein
MGNPHRKSMEIGALNSRGPQETVDAVHHRAGKDRIIESSLARWTYNMSVNIIHLWMDR